MKFIGPKDASQLATLVASVRAGESPEVALSRVVIHDAFARQVAHAIAGRKRVPAKAKKVAADLAKTVP